MHAAFLALSTRPVFVAPVVDCRGAVGMSMAVDFSGQWSMDLKASDPLRPTLKALGVPSLLAAVIERLRVEQTVVQDDSMVRVTVKTPLATDVVELRPDSTPTKVRGVTGGEVDAVTRWLDGGRLETRQSLDAAADCSPDDPRASCFVTVRSLHGDGGDARELWEEVEVVREGQPVPGTTARRILRKA